MPKPLSHYTTTHKLGMSNIQKFGMDVHWPVFPISAIIILAFIVGVLVEPKVSQVLFNDTKDWIINEFHWVFMLGVNAFLILFLLLGLTPLGSIKIGGAEAEPEFSLISWFSMLFAAGMGIGLMFWSVAEPVAYFTNWYGTPFNVEAKTPEAYELAFAASIYHWGFHAWSVYGVVALSLAFFSYNKGLPLTIRSAFYPLLGNRIWGWPGHVIDILAVLATIFGLATSLGFGAKQVASGVAYLFEFQGGIALQVGVIAVVTILAIISVVRGLDGGVKVLSNLNLIIASLLFAFVVIVGNPLVVLGHFYELVVGYFKNILPLSNMVGREDQTFYKEWTIFYWAWWVAWSPFVGSFIARVSKGRTIRTFVIAVFCVPVLITALWMAAFGGLALDQINQGVGDLANGMSEASMATFQMLSQLPLASITTVIGIILVMVFFITSSDSGSLVIDSITSGGHLNAPVVQRIFWATLQGGIAAALLFGGGTNALDALQTASIITGLPFVMVLMCMMFALCKGLVQEYKRLDA